MLQISEKRSGGASMIWIYTKNGRRNTDKSGEIQRSLPEKEKIRKHPSKGWHARIDRAMNETIKNRAVDEPD
jgi:hypothetical protein